MGFPCRSHYWDKGSSKWVYSSQWTNECSMILTSGAFYHRLVNTQAVCRCSLDMLWRYANNDINAIYVVDMGTWRSRGCRLGCTYVELSPQLAIWVLVAHWSSSGCGFNPRLGLRNCFSEVRTRRTFIIKHSQSCLTHCFIRTAYMTRLSPAIDRSDVCGWLVGVFTKYCYISERIVSRSCGYETKLHTPG